MIQLCQQNDLKFTILPGANALVPAIVSAGFDTSNFVYIGFLPQKKGRQTALKNAISSQLPTFFYESVHRVERLFKELQELGFEGKIAVARELSKLFEELKTADFAEFVQQWQAGKFTLKGEFVIGLCPEK